MDSNYQKPLRIYLVSSPDSPEFSHLSRALTRSNLIAFDAEWKPIRSHQHNFPIVSLLQLACQFDRRLCSDSDELNESAVYLLDLSSIPLSSIWKLLKEVFVSPDVLKLGFKFKQDLIYLSSTFCLQGCEPGFDRVSFELLITVSFSLIYLFFLGGKWLLMNYLKWVIDIFKLKWKNFSFFLKLMIIFARVLWKVEDEAHVLVMLWDLSEEHVMLLGFFKFWVII